MHKLSKEIIDTFDPFTDCYSHRYRKVSLSKFKYVDSAFGLVICGPGKVFSTKPESIGSDVLYLSNFIFNDCGESVKYPNWQKFGIVKDRTAYTDFHLADFLNKRYNFLYEAFREEQHLFIHTYDYFELLLRGHDLPWTKEDYE